MRRFAVLFAGLVLAASAVAAAPAPSPATQLKPEPRQVLIARTAVQVAQTRHYPAEPLDTKLAHAVLHEYLDSLDPGRFYFTQKAIDRFHAKYDKALPRDLRHGNLQPGFAIYRYYISQVRHQIRYALALLKTKPTFTGSDSYRFERRHAPWAATQDALDKLWRERVQNDVLTIMLTGKNWADAVKVLRKRYEYALKTVNQTSSTDVFGAYMNAYMQTLDPHSSYFTPFQSQQFQIEMSLQLQGIGAQLTTRDGYVTIVRILPGGPAAKNGELKPGDRILGVGQGAKGSMVDVVGWRLDDVVKKIRGKKGTTVRLRVLPAGALPGGSEKLITLVRNTVELDAERAHAHTMLVRHGSAVYRIGVIDIPSFYVNFQAPASGEGSSPSVTSDVRALVAKLKKEKVSGILLDLRNNGGGSLEQAESLTGLFIPDGPVVQVQDRSGRVQVLRTPSGEQAVWTGPLAVIVNRFSASATEIFTGALQDYHRALVLGSRTWGKGTVQTLVPLSDYLPGFKAGEMKLTMAQFFRVNGSSTQHRGVEPDLKIPSPINDHVFGEDSYPNALPWKSIAPADYHLVKDGITRTLPEIQKYFQDTVQKEPRYQLFEREVSSMRKRAALTELPLNMAKRKAERARHRAEELHFDNAWRKLEGKPPFKSLKAAASSEFSTPDIALDASAELLGDYLSLASGINARLASPVQALSTGTLTSCLKEADAASNNPVCKESSKKKAATHGPHAATAKGSGGH